MPLNSLGFTASLFWKELSFYAIVDCFQFQCSGEWFTLFLVFFSVAESFTKDNNFRNDNGNTAWILFLLPDFGIIVMYHVGARLSRINLRNSPDINHS